MGVDSTIGGYVVGGVDSAASVQAALNAYN